MTIHDLMLDPLFDIQDYIDRLVKDLKLYKEECNRLSELAYQRQQRIDKLETFIDEIIKTLKHCKLNGTNKLDIVSEFIEKEYNEQIKGSDE